MFCAPRSRTRKTGNGFSLIEMVVSIVVLGVLAAVTAPVFTTSMRTYVESDAHLTTLSKARYATERIARELREVQYNSGTGTFSFTAMGANSVTFTKWNGTTVALSVAGANVNMRYTPPNVTAPLTDELGSLTLAYLDSTGAGGATPATVRGIDVTLTLTNRGATHTQRVHVGLRSQP